MIQIHDISGFCPVQALGTVDGHPFYFRARGPLTIQVADYPNAEPSMVGIGATGWKWDGTDDPEWIDRSGGTVVDGLPYFGWMDLVTARECVEKVLTAYLAGPVDGKDGWTRYE